MEIIPSKPPKWKPTYLIEESPQSFQETLAYILGGMEEAVFLQQIYWWSKNPYHRGMKLERAYDQFERVWVAIPPIVFEEKFGYRSESTRKRILNALKSMGVIIVEQFDKHLGDQTNFYHVVQIEVDRLTQEYLSNQPEPEDLPPSPGFTAAKKRLERGRRAASGQNEPMQRVSKQAPTGNLFSAAYGDENEAHGDQNDDLHQANLNAASGQTEPLYRGSDWTAVQGVKLNRSSTRSTKGNKSLLKEQQQITDVVVSDRNSIFILGDLTIEKVINEWMRIETSLNRDDISRLVEASPEHAAQQLIWFKDRPYAEVEWCARQEPPINRAGLIRRILQYVPGHAKYYHEPADARKRRERAEAWALKTAEDREKAEAKRLAEAEAREISASKFKGAANAFSIWRTLSDDAKAYLENRVAQEKPAVADRVGRTANGKGIETIESGSPYWVEYLEVIDAYMDDALEEFPMVSATPVIEPAEEDDLPEEVEVYDFQELPPPDAAEIIERQIARFVADVQDDVIDPDNLQREYWMDFTDEQWAHICAEVKQKVEESES